MGHMIHMHVQQSAWSQQCSPIIPIAEFAMLRWESKAMLDAIADCRCVKRGGTPLERAKRGRITMSLGAERTKEEQALCWTKRWLSPCLRPGTFTIRYRCYCCGAVVARASPESKSQVSLNASSSMAEADSISKKVRELEATDGDERVAAWAEKARDRRDLRMLGVGAYGMVWVEWSSDEPEARAFSAKFSI